MVVRRYLSRPKPRGEDRAQKETVAVWLSCVFPTLPVCATAAAV
ncbi:uncharacterized protein G2W53_007417 [Senna tora]|uniref:Uncharacterized protein n=1 Tax=Senna tora TaxID=362788 RepID=A0A835CFN5_9FABA|nr:uncharacterized protein G2W53_007417 [Senna tora]